MDQIGEEQPTQRQSDNIQNAQNGQSDATTALELAKKVLIIHRPRPGEPGDFWTSGYGVVSIPDGWEFLPRGNTYITREVKKGPHWILMGRYIGR